MAETIKKNGIVHRGKVISTCHYSKLTASRGDGVWIGSCLVCSVYVARINPRTGVAEYLDGKSPWTPDDDLRLVEW